MGRSCLETRMTKADEYKHPKWQAMRLKTLERFEFKCFVCDDTEKTLHVHHKRYPKGKKIWECGDNDLIVLCEECHKDTESLVSFVREHGPELHFCFKRSSVKFCKPEDLLQMFIEHASGQMSTAASEVFEIAIHAIYTTETLDGAGKE